MSNLKQNRSQPNFYVDGMPIGSVTAYTGNTTPPAGYMWLRKTKLNKIAYAGLYAVMGDVFNDGTQASTEFMLPDPEGYFIRAFDSTGLVDPGRVFGSKQADLLGSHLHAQTINLTGGAAANRSSGDQVGNATAAQTLSNNSTTATGGVETRPKNLALNYIIKVTDGYKYSSVLDMASAAADIAVLKSKAALSPLGFSRNGRGSLNSTSQFTYAADELFVEDTSGGAYRLPAFSKSISLATGSGLGFMDTGVVPATGYIAIYAVYNPSTGVSGLLGFNSTSVVAPNTYQGTAAVSGFVASALLCVVPTSSSLFKNLYVRDRKTYVNLTLAFTGAGQAVTLTSLSAAIPPNAVEASGEMQVISSVSASLTFVVYGDANGTGQQWISANPLTSLGGSFTNIPVLTSQSLYLGINNNSAGGTVTSNIWVTSYSI